MSYIKKILHQTLLTIFYFIKILPFFSIKQKMVFNPNYKKLILGRACPIWDFTCFTFRWYVVLRVRIA